MVASKTERWPTYPKFQAENLVLIRNDGIGIWKTIFILLISGVYDW